MNSTTGLAIRLTVALLAALLTNAPATAQVLRVENLKQEFALQTSNAPTQSNVTLVAEGAQYTFRAFVAEDSGLSQISLSPPSAFFAISMFPPDFQFVSDRVAGDRTTLEAVYGSGEYFIQYFGGPLAGENDSFQQPQVNFYPSFAPVFLGNTYSFLQSYAPNTDIALAWASFSSPADSRLVTIELIEIPATGDPIYFEEIQDNGAAGALTLAAEDFNEPLTSDGQYELRLTFETREDVTDPSGTAFSMEARFQRITAIRFTPAGAPTLLSVRSRKQHG